MTNIHPSKLSLSYILNPSLSSAMEEDTDQEVDRIIIPPPQATTTTWQSCRPSVNLPCKLPPFSHLAQHHHLQQQTQPPQQPQHNTPTQQLPDYRFTFPLRRETSAPLPNIAFFQHSHNKHNNEEEEEEENNSKQQDSMPISPAFTSIAEFEPTTRGKRANTAPTPTATKKYRMKKFTQATSPSMAANSKRQPPRKISAEQLSYLEKAFEEDRMPDTTTKMRISQHLNLSPQQVKIWFQNKRARMRRMERALNPNEEETQTGGITFHFFESQDFIHEY